MKKMRIGDEVKVIAGKDKGRTGKVLRLLQKHSNPAQGFWVIVEGLHKVVKHIKPNPQANQAGGIVSKETPIHISNVQVLNPATGKGGKVGIRKTDDGKQVRYFKATGEVVDV